MNRYKNCSKELQTYQPYHHGNFTCNTLQLSYKFTFSGTLWMKYHTTYKSDFPIAITPHVPSAILSSSCRTIQADIFIKAQRRDNSILQNYNVAFSENIVILYKHFTRGIAITIITRTIIQLYTIQYWPTCHLCYKIAIDYTKKT